MNDTKIISQYLYELAKESKSKFIDINEESELIQVAKKMNIVIPNPDIAILETTYAEVNVPNLNKVIIYKDDVKKGLSTIVGKQANWNHGGSYQICGWILDGKLENNGLITIYTAIFKSSFVDEFKTVKKLFEEGKLSVSFEIWSKDENEKSVLHDLKDGTKFVSPIVFHGVGILINGEKPACSKAYAKKLLAMFNIDKSKEVIKSEADKFLVFASAYNEEKICNSCSICECKKEDNKVDELLKKDEIIPEETKEAASTEVIAPAETNLDAQKKKKLCSKCNEEMPEDEKDEVCSKCKKIKAEEVVVTPAEVVVAQPIVEKKLVKTIEEITAIRTVTYVDGGDIIESKTVRKTTNEYNDGTKSEILNDVEVKDTLIFTQAQLDEAIANAKTEKDLEIATLKEANDKLLKEKSDELIASQSKFDSDLKISNEEIVTLKAQVGDKDKEIAKLTPTVKEEVELTVGSIEKTNNVYKSLAKEVDAKAFPQPKK